MFVFDEVERRPEASLHVPEPGEPVVVYGLDIPALRELHDARAAEAMTTPKNGKPRRIRQDQNTLVGIVLSHPATMAEDKENPNIRSDVESWQARSVAWLQGLYGEKLVTVVRHEDESHPHLHAYVLPDDSEMKAGPLHPGFLAKAAVKEARPRPSEDDKNLNKRADAAYKSAMREWLNDYHTKVSQPCGLTRLGPRKRRLTRAEWQHEKVQARALRVSLDRAANIKKRIESLVATKRKETESIISAAETTAAALKVEAEAARADAARRLAEAKAVTDAAVAEQRKAKSMMSRVREEAVRVKAATARLQKLPTLLRTVFDGFRQSKIADRLRAAVDAEMDRLREQASAASDRASAADTARRKAEERAWNLERGMTETVAQRDAARREVARLRPPEPQREVSTGLAMKPKPW
ncbi:hypothetical protein G6K98_15965 [Agrobacterium rhizogenes]|nr:hypothetical protein [Rhizobium rhizogenes]NTH59491.1 hypothetical protein [Rhizobium rhizogenes]NTH90642.1 hypothetical protein [Rhizobium rhizogenes]